MTDRTRPNPRVQGTGYWLADVLALRVTEALDHLHREHVICDGFPAKGETAGRGNSDSTTTEAAAIARQYITRQAEDLKDAIDGLVISANHLAAMITEATKTRAPDIVKIARCRDNQIGREGAIVWGNPTCLEIPVKAGYCSACYQRERRWRATQGLEARDVEPAA